MHAVHVAAEEDRAFWLDTVVLRNADLVPSLIASHFERTVSLTALSVYHHHQCFCWKRNHDQVFGRKGTACENVNSRMHRKNMEKHL